eukprot:m.121560 g.121560  ORF g.121560 m.121560 type:complete len:474 (-) comp14581_c0_seq2:84-1505(-)
MQCPPQWAFLLDVPLPATAQAQRLQSWFLSHGATERDIFQLLSWLQNPCPQPSSPHLLTNMNALPLATQDAVFLFLEKNSLKLPPACIELHARLRTEAIHVQREEKEVMRSAYAAADLVVAAIRAQQRKHKAEASLNETVRSQKVARSGASGDVAKRVDEADELESDKEMNESEEEPFKPSPVFSQSQRSRGTQRSRTSDPIAAEILAHWRPELAGAAGAAGAGSAGARASGKGSSQGAMGARTGTGVAPDALLREFVQSSASINEVAKSLVWAAVPEARAALIASSMAGVVADPTLALSPLRTLFSALVLPLIHSLTKTASRALSTALVKLFKAAALPAAEGLVSLLQKPLEATQRDLILRVVREGGPDLLAETLSRLGTRDEPWQASQSTVVQAMLALHPPLTSEALANVVRTMCARAEACAACLKFASAFQTLLREYRGQLSEHKAMLLPAAGSLTTFLRDACVAAATAL